MKLAIDAMMISPGGGLTGLYHYLKCWAENEDFKKIFVFSSRQSVLKELENGGFHCTLIPTLVGASRAKVFCHRKLRLFREISSLSPDVLLTTNTMVGKSPVPQLVHQRNLKHFNNGKFHGAIHSAFAFSELIRNHSARNAARHAEANVFVSNFLMQQAKGFVPHPYGQWHVVHNGVSGCDVNYECRVEPKSQSNIVAVTSDSSHKNNIALVMVMAELLKINPSVDWRMQVAGAGQYLKERKLAMKLGISDRIHWLGFQDVSSLNLLFKNAFVFVFPTLLESFGNPPLEAMIRRCPVVASDCTAIPEIVGDAGILCPPKNAVAFAAAIYSIFEDDNLRLDLIEKGANRVSLFTWDASAAKMFNVMKSIAR